MNSSECVFELDRLSELQRLDDLGPNSERVRERLDKVAERRTA